MKTILVIDDNKDILENISELIELLGYKVVSANNGFKGIDIANSTKIDLILCDIRMQQIDGFEVLQELNKSARSVPFVFMTALSEPETRKKGMGLGACGYLIKPFDEVELIETIEASMKKNIFFRLSQLSSYFTMAKKPGQGYSTG